MHHAVHDPTPWNLDIEKLSTINKKVNTNGLVDLVFQKRKGKIKKAHPKYKRDSSSKHINEKTSFYHPQREMNSASIIISKLLHHKKQTLWHCKYIELSLRATKVPLQIWQLGVTWFKPRKPYDRSSQQHGYCNN